MDYFPNEGHFRESHGYERNRNQQYSGSSRRKSYNNEYQQAGPSRGRHYSGVVPFPRF